MNQPASSPALVQVHMTMTSPSITTGDVAVVCRCSWADSASTVESARELGDAHLAEANRP